MKTASDDKVDAQSILVNKNGFPLTQDTLSGMWLHVRQHHPDGDTLQQTILNNTKLEKVSKPLLRLKVNMEVVERLKLIQNYLLSLQYNFTGMQFFHVNKHRPISRLMDVAKEIIAESLPIKCLEAVIVVIHLTSHQTELQRFTIRFKSSFNGLTHRHVVLGIRYKSRYGAIGLSRREDLGGKTLTYKHLFDLLSSYKSSYEKYHHALKSVRLGAILPRDSHTCTAIDWSFMHLNFCKSTEQLRSDCDQYIKHIKTINAT